MAGNILVASYPTVALFDSGASHSFISARLATRLGMEFKSLPGRLN
ncbi:aspartyl protease family protein, partial [Psychroflexus curvus]